MIKIKISHKLFTQVKPITILINKKDFTDNPKVFMMSTCKKLKILRHFGYKPSEIYICTQQLIIEKVTKS